MDEPAIAKVIFTSEDRVRAAIHTFNADSFDSLYPATRGPPSGVHTRAASGDQAPRNNNVEVAYVPTNTSWMNRIEAQFTALHYFTLVHP